MLAARKRTQSAILNAMLKICFSFDDDDVLIVVEFMCIFGNIRKKCRGNHHVLYLPLSTALSLPLLYYASILLS